MTRIIMSGCNGKMGRVISLCVQEREDCEIVAGVDICTKKEHSFDVFDSIQEVDTPADVIIDFSTPAALYSVLKYCQEKSLPLVLCTTGFSKAQENDIKIASKKIPIFYSGNMSLGINLVMELSKKAAEVLGNDFDIEIIEKHHNQKVDAPSGTAFMIADSISSKLKNKPSFIYDRHACRKPRSKNEIGIHSIRGGTIVGEHEVIFAGRDEILKISHSAGSKEIFATGAVNAAIFMVDKTPGVYKMSDLLNK